MELRGGELALGLVPEIGGSVAYFRWKGRDLMRPLSDEARRCGNVLGVAMFPMAPYANRIEGNEFLFEGRPYRFQANNPPERFNVHGTGWHTPWCIKQAGVSEAVLELEDLKPDAPYSYRAVQHFRLSPEGLIVAMAITNHGKVPMPFGFGLHPWFERDPDVTLRFAASHFWLEGPDHIATEAISIPPQLDFSARAPLPSTWRNNDYGGWSGRAEIRYPSRGAGLRVEADPIFRHLMLYNDPTKPYFCLEPQTNAVCAFNKTGQSGRMDADLGIIVLAAGETAQGCVRFTPFAL